MGAQDRLLLDSILKEDNQDERAAALWKKIRIQDVLAASAFKKLEIESILDSFRHLMTRILDGTEFARGFYEILLFSISMAFPSRPRGLGGEDGGPLARIARHYMDICHEKWGQSEGGLGDDSVLERCARDLEKIAEFCKKRLQED